MNPEFGVVFHIHDTYVQLRGELEKYLAHSTAAILLCLGWISSVPRNFFRGGGGGG
jgi:hypothetical protein